MQKNSKLETPNMMQQYNTLSMRVIFFSVGLYKGMLEAGRKIIP